MDEPDPEAADAWTPDGPYACAGCGAVTAKSDFSKKQLKKSNFGNMRCTACMEEAHTAVGVDVKVIQAPLSMFYMGNH